LSFGNLKEQKRKTLFPLFLVHIHVILQGEIAQKHVIRRERGKWLTSLRASMSVYWDLN